LRKFRTDEIWNPSMFNDPEWDEQVLDAVKTRDEDQRIEMVRGLTIELLEQAPLVWLPTPYVYAAWWPWVKNYSGELRAGAVRPGPIYARLWIDQQLKRDMGFE
jgi:peptide/nickel transport system substrate-binding protein